jgi:broad specificity phosphatase PhoE
VSPLWRCLQTADLTWEGVELPQQRPFRPVIKEILREVMGVHTCDRRSTRSEIVAGFPPPKWTVEEGFAEEDELWEEEHRETWGEHDGRTQRLMDDVVGGSDAQEGEEGAFEVVSFTAHSGTITSLLRVTGHREFRLPTGGIIPVLVKAMRVE